MAQESMHQTLPGEKHLLAPARHLDRHDDGPVRGLFELEPHGLAQRLEVGARLDDGVPVFLYGSTTAT
jgi:hypothetical protein